MQKYALALSLSLLTCEAAEPGFTRITANAFSQSSATGASWADFNHDGLVDLALSTFQGNYGVYTNQGNGLFSLCTSDEVYTASGASFGACVADYDNDGHPDLFIGRNFSLGDYLFHNDGNGILKRVLSGDIVSGNGNANNCAWGDYDNDGLVDLFVANSDQRDYLLRNTGNGAFTRVTTGIIAEKTGNSQGGSWGDYDNDGRLDLFVSRVNEPNLLYHNEGNGKFTQFLTGEIVNEPGTGQGTSWGDYNNDGFLDMFVGMPGSRNLFYRNNGNGTFTKIINSVVSADSFGLGATWADFDNDGFLDLFVPCNSVSPLFYLNNGDGTFRKSATNSLVVDFSGGFTSCAGDMDNDGFQDLFISSGRSSSFLYRNHGNSNGWITFECEGRISNRAAIGTKLRIETMMGGRLLTQFREISGGGALGSQNDLRTSFGLGNATNVMRLELEWPSGLKQVITNLPTRRFMRIIEPDINLSSYHQFVGPGTDVTIEGRTSLSNVAWQWYFNDAVLDGETNSNLTLTITNRQTEKFGKYSLVGQSPEHGIFFVKPSILGGNVTMTQPASVNVRPGLTANFVVNASGYGPLRYQWFYNGEKILNATNSNLSITNVNVVNDGNYFIVVSNAFGAITSSIVSLGTLITPTFLEHPKSQSVIVGDNVRISVRATGNPAPFGYRLRHNGVIITNGVANEREFTFLIPNARTNDSGTYAIVLTNAAHTGGIISRNAFIQVLTDQDGDRLPDLWETLFKLDPKDPADSHLDIDSDGLSNLQEYAAQTNPTNSSSVLKLQAAYLTPDQRNAVIEFLAVSNITYVVETAGIDQPWTKWREHYSTTNAHVYFTNLIEPHSIRWFRVGILPGN